MKTLVQAVFFLLISSSVLAQNKIQKIDSVLTSLHAAGKINGNFLIAEKGNIIYKKSFGVANEETRARIDENTIFELASVSKQFTAMAVALLKEKGKLSYDDEISKYLPQLDFYKGITIRNLVHHTGGLPDYMELMDSVWDKSKIATNKDILNVFAQHKPPVLFAPGAKFEYSNTGYALLASIIEKTSGQTFGDFLKTNIFEPLGMNSTFVHTRRFAPRAISNYAYGYVFDERNKRFVLPDSLEDYSIVMWLDGIVGDGTVNSTIGDMLKWDRALYNNTLASIATMDEIFTSGKLADGSETEYGFGWFVTTMNDFGKVANHSGGWPGYSTFIERHLDNDKTIIMMQNHERSVLPAKSIRYLLYDKPIPVPPQRKEISLPVEVLTSYIGEYELQPGVILKVFMEGNGLKTQLTGQSAFPIYPESENKFFLKVVDAQLEFLKDADNKVTKAVMHQNGRQTEVLKIR
ncbi:MAG TPA: serine hydrolase [Patescibacteria group bacterium]|nr:serine hydrolase [Patescibacteria group bacterium]